MVKCKILVLTDVNVSGVYSIIAKMLSEDDQFDVCFIDINSKKSIFDDYRWYDMEFNNFYNISSKLFGSICNYFYIVRSIQKADICFCSGAISWLVRFLNKPYIYFCYGSDLDQYSKFGCSIFQKVNNHRKIGRKILYKILKIYFFLKKQQYRYGIGGANITVVSPYQFEDIKNLGYKELGFFPHVIESQFMFYDIEDKSRDKNEICAEYNCEYVLFSPTRHVWNEKFKDENDYKGNDVVIRSFAELLKKSIYKNSKLFLINKGQDVSQSKELVFKMGISDSVVWLDPMNRHKLIKFYGASDFCFDQFSRGCLAMCAVEAMACGTPVISYIGEYNYNITPFYKEAPPVFNNKNPEEIARMIAMTIILS
ncbi:MAG: glycosyltransferase [Actinobacteria bacterium]|nr:glycosyltransferase [Actinomycetota bacterium]